MGLAANLTQLKMVSVNWKIKHKRYTDWNMDIQTDGKHKKEDTKLTEHSANVQPMCKRDSRRRRHKGGTKAI